MRALYELVLQSPLRNALLAGAIIALPGVTRACNGVVLLANPLVSLERRRNLYLVCAEKSAY